VRFDADGSTSEQQGAVLLGERLRR
jgi:hypothetical protein